MQEARESSRKFVGGLNLGNDFRRRFQANNGLDSPLPLASPALTYDAMANMHMIPTNLLTPGIAMQSPQFSQGHFTSSPSLPINGAMGHAISPLHSPGIQFTQNSLDQYFATPALQQLPVSRTVYIGNIPEDTPTEYVRLSLQTYCADWP